MSKNGDQRHFRKAHSLCWDCENATNNACPWVRDGTPVPGWNADPSRVKHSGVMYDSFHVRWCPLFHRDADNGGMVKHRSFLEFIPLESEESTSENSDSSERTSASPLCRVDKRIGTNPLGSGSGRVVVQANGRPRDVTRDPMDLAFAIVQRAVEDWRCLDNGRRESTLVDGVVVNRKEVVEFFFSKWFKELIEPTGYTPQQIRKALRIDEDALRRVNEEVRWNPDVR